MAVIEITNDQVSLPALEGKTLLENTLLSGVPHAHACGGQGLCSSCRVFVEKGIEHFSPMKDKERNLLKKLGLSDRIRLACQSKVEGDIVIRRLVLDEIDQQIVAGQAMDKSGKSLGIQKEASILFVDIADYTAFAENTPPYDIVHILNKYFYICGTIVKKYNGRIIDYYGDGFLAIFGLDDDPMHSENLVKAGFELCEAIDRFDLAVHQMTNSDFKIRLGAHTGSIIWGTIGIEGMQKEAAIGDTVNLASRIENANKDLNTRFLVSEALYNKLKSKCSFCDEHLIKAKGKKGFFKVYALDRHFID